MKQKMRTLTFFLLVAGIVTLQSCVNKKPNEKNVVPLGTAKTRVGVYKALIPVRSDTGIADGRALAFYYRSEAFTKNDIEAILAESGCDGIRIYHAIDADGRSIMYIVGKNNAGNDLLPDSTSRSPAATQVENNKNYVIKSEVPCPEMCPPNGL